MIIVHVVESFSAGTFDFLVSLTESLKEDRHIIIHGMRSDTPVDFQMQFPQDTQFVNWKVSRSINPYQDLNSLITLIRILKSLEHIDVIHLHSSKAGFLGRIATRIIGLSKYVIFTPHGASFLRRDVSKIERSLYVFLEKMANNCGGRVIACSPSEAEEFLRYKIQAEYICNGIDQNSKLKQARLTTCYVKIGIMGRITDQKNPKLFNQIAFAFHDHPEITFVWIGDGEKKSVLNSDNIQITGWLPQKEASNVLATLDIYLSTSSWEGLSLATLQAMSLGNPLILSNCVGNKDLVLHGQNGYCYDTIEQALDYIQILISNPELLKSMGERSREIFLEGFTIQNMAEKYRAIYQHIIESK